MNSEPFHLSPVLPDSLEDVLKRLKAEEKVFGFELDLLADFVSQ